VETNAAVVLLAQAGSLDCSATVGLAPALLGALRVVYFSGSGDGVKFNLWWHSLSIANKFGLPADGLCAGVQLAGALRWVICVY